MSEAERAILGAVIVDNAHMSTAIDLLRPEFFTGPHRSIYRAITRLADADKPVDLTTLRDELEGMGDLAEVGGAVYLAGLIDGVPKTQDITPWTNILRERALRKYASDLGRRLTQEAADEAVATDVLIDRHMSSIQKLMESFETGNTSHIGTILNRSMEALKEFVASKFGLTGVPSGLADLDVTTCGFQPGTLVIVAARPGNGKTTLLAQMAGHAAEMGFKGLVFSMEMEPYQIAQRMLLADAEVDRWQLKVKHDTTKEWEKIDESRVRLSQSSLWFDGREQPTLAQIRAASARHKAKYGLDFVMVDYLQRIPVDPKLENWLGVGENAKGLKTLARQLHIPVIAACQLGRGADESEPTFKDLAQSGTIEREADIVLMMHPETPMTQPYPQVALIVAKHRAGATMRIPMSFQKEHTKFLNLARGPETQGAEIKNWRGDQ